MSEWEEVPVSTGEKPVEQVYHAEAMGGEAPQVPMVQRRTAYQTAVAVIRPRNLKQVESEILMEAESAGEEFFYSIPFKKKDGSVENVRDGSIDLAYAFMRAMGNCAITTVDEDISAPDGHHWSLKSTFIDLEKGTNYERTVRRKAGSGTLGGLAKKDPQRVYDMRFGAAQSISQRNAIKAGVPGWIWKRAVSKAIDAATAAINKETPAVAIEKAIKHFAGMGVTLEMIEKALGRARAAWETDDILKLRGYATAIKDGQTSAEGIFGRPEPPKPEAPPETEKAAPPEAAGHTEPSKAAPEKQKRTRAAKAGVSSEDPAHSTGKDENVQSGPSDGPQGPVQEEGEGQPQTGQVEQPPKQGLTFPALMETLQKNPGLQFAEGAVVSSKQPGLAPLAEIKGVEWGQEDGACFLRLKFAPNLSELVHDLTKEEVIRAFKEGGIYIEDADAPPEAEAAPPPATGGKKAGRPKAADIREECRALMVKHSISWEEPGRFFPGNSIDECPDASMSGLLSWLQSRTGQ